MSLLRSRWVALVATVPLVALGITLVAIAAPHARAAARPADESVTVRLEPRQNSTSLVNYYRPMRITLTDKPEATLKAEPEYHSDKPLYGTMKLGEGENNLITVVVDEADGHEPRIFIDRNNDQDLTNDGPPEWTRTAGQTLFRSGVKIDVPYESGPVPYTFEFYRFKERLRDLVLYYRNAYREGTVPSGGKSYKIAVLDENSDGRFDDLENCTLLIDLNGDGKLVGTSDSAELYQLDEPFNIHGQVWEVASMSPDGTKLVLRPSQAKVEMKPYLDPGYPAPPFAGTGLDDQPVGIDKLPDDAKYVLLDFWASWCGPCRQEYPFLRRLNAQYKEHGLRIIGVNLDQERGRAEAMAKSELLDYPHVFDGLVWKNAVAVLYRVHGIPQTYLLDRDLKIVAKGLRGAALERRLGELLGEGDVEAAAAADKAKSTRGSRPAPEGKSP